MKVIFYFSARFPTNGIALTPTKLHGCKSGSQEFRVRHLLPLSSPSSCCSGSAASLCRIHPLSLSLTFSIRYCCPLPGIVIHCRLQPVVHCSALRSSVSAGCATIKDKHFSAVLPPTLLSLSLCRMCPSEWHSSYTGTS